MAGIITIVGLTPGELDADPAGAAAEAQAAAIEEAIRLNDALAEKQLSDITEVKALIEGLIPISHNHWWGHGRVLVGNPFSINKNPDPPFYYRAYQHPANLNDEAEFDFILKKGSYKVSLIGVKQANLGIVRCFIDDIPIGDFDLYYPQYTGIESFVNLEFTLTTSGRHKLKTKVMGKNAASEGYYFVLSAVIISPK